MEVFLLIWHCLDRKCSISLDISRSNTIVIKISSESWDTINTTVKNYFNECYGEKYVNFQKLSYIYNAINDKNFVKSNESIAELVDIRYNMNISGSIRKSTKKELMDRFNINISDGTVYNRKVWNDNLLPIFIPFVIGMIVGDGTMFIRLRDTGKSIWSIPTISIYQTETKMNIQLMLKIKDFLEKQNISSVFHSNNSLSIRGISNVTNHVMPLFFPGKHSNLFYWKYYQYELLMRVTKFSFVKAHRVPQSFEKMIHIIYRYNTNRHYSRNYWIQKIYKYSQLLAVDNRSKIRGLDNVIVLLHILELGK